MYGVYIAPLPGDELVTVVPETEVSNKTGNGNDRRKSTGAQCNVRAGRGVKENSTPVATGKSRKEGSQRDENETTTPANQRPRSQQLTRTMSDTYISRYEGREAKSSRKAGQQRETTVDDQRSSGEQATKRKSLNEAERRIEDEVVEAMRREQELRYKATCIRLRMYLFNVTSYYLQCKSLPTCHPTVLTGAFQVNPGEPVFSRISFNTCCLQCFDAVGWATGRASGL